MDFCNFMRKIEGKPVEPEVNTTRFSTVYLCSVGQTYYNAYECQRVLDGDTSGLTRAFKWSTTSEGYRYWSARSTGRVEMSHSDYEFVRALMEYMEDL